MSEPWVGRSLRRREDERLLRGRGEFVADTQPLDAVPTLERALAPGALVVHDGSSRPHLSTATLGTCRAGDPAGHGRSRAKGRT